MAEGYAPRVTVCSFISLFTVVYWFVLCGKVFIDIC